MEREATGFPLSGPARDVEPMGMLRVRGVSCSGWSPREGGGCGAGHAVCAQTMGCGGDNEKMSDSQCRMDLPVQPIRGETNKKPFKQTLKK